ncbi:MAG: bifunctional phosphopantothenoylcysteine decarboxylase/phosphopantothenate--cysteine ligase CoaBC [Actinobacteria bacterium]|nr:bifunctional phosphopantothenoylcysteine decarboxylase/phosphopantothenate--cysteine ligase CoaBC [Actinomycetota bacterium]MEC7810630.1 bifunctional phosphopantothenoylcysteine decarboxylase/phosphopantothenate--cysteine ligase CoaBC [Actinomycetota bacterium]MED5276581.1 bifunctional phosphopantothenoylcysteine decarboxylase/phosphopantothenate--cysteine ligase CoaBC [Actinomycetota bacterium]|tara:strand:+ start:764 stop:2005 length:1242 start_codon:yes stop_codon:yes gene_type:complete
MGQLDGRRIVLGITGGIAAYKAIEVCRRLTDAGAHVAPVMTKGALRFVGKSTFDALGSEKTQISLWDENHSIPHTRLGQGADLIVVCPATARLISDYRNGRSGDLLTATLLATRSKVMVCPAMHTEMWEQASVAENISVLRERGVEIVGPVEGKLAGGDNGFGRLAEPDDIVDSIFKLLGKDSGHQTGDLAGLTVLVTAGGTREPIGPVRFIGNRSSGKQGHALASEAVSRGAKVICITTEAESAPDILGVELIETETAQEMHDAVMENASRADWVFMAAAVADFRPKKIASQKIKKEEGLTEITLEPTLDILQAISKKRKDSQLIIGFAAETNDLLQNAARKLESKNLDFIIANDVSEPDVGFGYDTNSVSVIDRNGLCSEISLCDKREVARNIIDIVSESWSEQGTHPKIQ